MAHHFNCLIYVNFHVEQWDDIWLMKEREFRIQQQCPILRPHPINLPIGCERNTEYLTIFHLAFGNVGNLKTNPEHYPLHSNFQHSPFEATGFTDEPYSPFITTPKSLPRVVPPIVGPLPERYKSGVYPLWYFFKIHVCVILLSRHFFHKCFLPFMPSGRNLLNN